MTHMAYTVPAREVRFEHEIKKSRFIAVVRRVATKGEAADALQEVKSEFPDATHHCWAYVLGDPQSSPVIRMSDDGEPSGTAGKPILNVLQHKNVGDIFLAVVRYFGGIKLGAGGLVRAYSSTASSVMARLEVTEKKPLRQARIRIDYAEESPVRKLLVEHGATVSSTRYGEHVELTIQFPEVGSQPLATALATLTSGRVKL